MISLPDSIDFLKDVSDLVWDSDPLDLLIRNEEAVRKMGGDESLIERFFENRYFTPTGQTVIVTALEKMNDVDHRLVLIEYASESQSKDDAGSIVRVAQFFQSYHSKNQRLTRLVATDYLPMAVNQEGHAILFVPVDQLRWLETVAEAARELTAIAQKVAPGKTGEMWVQGRVSKAAETNSPGWRIFPGAFKRFTEQG